MSDLPLDSDLINEHQQNKPNIVEIQTYAFEHEARLAQAILKAAGIPSFLSNANMLSVYSGLSAGLGGVGLMVMAKDIERAEQVLLETPNPIEIDDEMLTDAYLENLELEAAETEQAEQLPKKSSWADNFSMIITIATIVTLIAYGIWKLLLLWT